MQRSKKINNIKNQAKSNGYNCSFFEGIDSYVKEYVNLKNRLIKQFSTIDEIIDMSIAEYLLISDNIHKKLRPNWTPVLWEVEDNDLVENYKKYSND